MRMRLYAAEFIRSDGIVNGHIVAPTIESATQFAKEYHDEIGVNVTRISLTRIDDKLPPEHQQGLDDVLESAPIGFASQCEPLGWFVHTVVPPRLKLYRIESEDGDVVQVVAPNPDITSAIWLSTLDLGDDGTHPLWTISNGLNHLSERQRTALQERLEFGPVGVVEWDDKRGWSQLDG